MTDIDAGKPVARSRLKKRRQTSWVDVTLVGSGVTMAVAAALFPWYVFFNEDKFGVVLPDWGRTRDLPEGQGRNVFSVSPLAMVDKDDSGPKLPQLPQLDPLVTATVSKLGDVRQEPRELSESQPFPGRDAFKLLHVANGRALIEDDTGMYMVRIGSVLPDNSRVATLEMRDGKWVIVTTNGDIYEND